MCQGQANALPQPSLVNRLVGARQVEKIVNRMMCSRPCLRGEDKIMPVRSPQLSVLDLHQLPFLDRFRSAIRISDNYSGWNYCALRS